MASVIVLVYGEDGHLVPKPADYTTLIDVARAKFPNLDGVNDDNIAFHFTPEWYDGEVKLDCDAFAEVHNRAVLHVTSTVSTLAEWSEYQWPVPSFPAECPEYQWPVPSSPAEWSEYQWPVSSFPAECPEYQWPVPSSPAEWSEYQWPVSSFPAECPEYQWPVPSSPAEWSEYQWPVPSSLAQYSGDDNYQGGVEEDQHSDYLPPNDRLTLCVIHVPTDRKVWLSVQPHTRMCRLMARAAAFVEVDRFDYDFEYQGQILEDDDTAQSMGMAHRDVIEMWSWA